MKIKGRKGFKYSVKTDEKYEQKVNNLKTKNNVHMAEN